MQKLYPRQDHPLSARIHNSWGHCLISMDRVDEAMSQLEVAISIWQRLDKYQGHPAKAITINNIAYCLTKQQKYEQALEKYGEALIILRNLYADDNPDVVTTIWKMAFCLEVLQRHNLSTLGFLGAMKGWQAYTQKNIMFLSEYEKVQLILGSSNKFCNPLYTMSLIKRTAKARDGFEASLIGKHLLFKSMCYEYDIYRSISSESLKLKIDKLNLLHNLLANLSTQKIFSVE